MNLLATPLGWLMRLIYGVVDSYGVAIVIFTVIIKLITLPSTYKMQVNSARMSLLNPQVEKLKKSYGNNPQRFQEEQTKLYTREGINMNPGCLSTIITMLLVLGVYQVVMRPMTYILQMSADITPAVELLTPWLAAHGLTEPDLESRTELILLKYAKTNPEIFASMEGFTEKLQGFDNTFLGFDLTGVPSLHPEGGWNFTSVMLILLPILSALASLALTIVTQVRQKRTNPDAPSMGLMNIMLYLSPLMTIWIGMKVPAGLSFYWLVNSVVSLLSMALIYWYLKGPRLERINEKAKAKQLAKGPGWMQKMMAASAEYANEGSSSSSGSKGNRTQYADGDDGMSRKERAEYNRKLIEAARQREAAKYGGSAGSGSNEPTDEERKLIEETRKRVAAKYGEEAPSEGGGEEE